MSAIWHVVQTLVDVFSMEGGDSTEGVDNTERTESPLPDTRRFVCCECDVTIDNGMSVFFVWDRTFCSNTCRSNHLETKLPPEINAVYNTLVLPRHWQKSQAQRENAHVYTCNKQEQFSHAGLSTQRSV